MISLKLKRIIHISVETRSNCAICYVIWLFVKRLSQEAIQRRSQRDRLVKIKVYINAISTQARNNNKSIFNLIRIIIVISIFLKRPQKRSRGNQLIHRCLFKTKSIGSGSDPES